MTEQISNEEQNKIVNNLQNLTEHFLEQATQHSDVWRRSLIPFPLEQTLTVFMDLEKNGIVTPLKNHFDYDNLIRIPLEDPKIGWIEVEEEDWSKRYPEAFKHPSRRIGLGFRYYYESPSGESDVDDVLVSIEWSRNPFVLYSHEYSSNYSETGYEGHNFRYKKLQPDQLKLLYDVMNSMSETGENIDVPIKQQLEDLTKRKQEASNKPQE